MYDTTGDVFDLRLPTFLIHISTSHSFGDHILPHTRLPPRSLRATSSFPLLLTALLPHSSNPKKAHSTGHGPNVAAAQVLFLAHCTVDRWISSTLSPSQVGGATLATPSSGLDNSTSAAQVRSELLSHSSLSTPSPHAGSSLEVVDWR